MGRSSTLKADIIALTLSPPKMRKILSSRDRKNRVEPESPCLPDLPLSWLSILRLSCLSVPMTWSPPKSSTRAFSSLVTSSYSALTASYASLIRSSTLPRASLFSHARARTSWASSSVIFSPSSCLVTYSEVTSRISEAFSLSSQG